jgi:beta-xylosidase
VSTYFESYSGDFADPEVVRVDSTYYAYATNAGPDNVQLLRSDDLHNWTHLGDALPALPSWARPGNTWAPSVLDRHGDGFVLYYTVSDGASGRQAISVATAAAPSGPFVDLSTRPLVFQYDEGGSIDPRVFVDADGRGYLFWKRDDTALNRRSSLWGQPLSADGLSLLARPVQLLDLDRPWEDPVVEGPAILLCDSTYYLFYSANWWESSDYAIGYAVSPHPLGPYQKVTTDGPWLASNAEADAAGPGGPALFTDAAGTWWMAHHAWHGARVGYRNGGVRSLRLVAIDIVGGRPQLI